MEFTIHRVPVEGHAAPGSAERRIGPMVCRLRRGVSSKSARTSRVVQRQFTGLGEAGPRGRLAPTKPYRERTLPSKSLSRAGGQAPRTPLRDPESRVQSPVFRDQRSEKQSTPKRMTGKLPTNQTKTDVGAAVRRIVAVARGRTTVGTVVDPRTATQNTNRTRLGACGILGR